MSSSGLRGIIEGKERGLFSHGDRVSQFGQSSLRSNRIKTGGKYGWTQLPSTRSQCRTEF
jgi:hypothetical protein